MKEEKKSIVIIVGMFVLLIFIILPPMFRVFVPKENNNNSINSSDVTVNSEDVLSCNLNHDDKYNTVTTIVYKKGNFSNCSITYNNISLLDINALILELENNSEYVFFKGLNDISLTNGDDFVNISFDTKLLDSNKDVEELNNYFQDIDKLNQYLTSKGYTCVVNPGS